MRRLVLALVASGVLAGATQPLAAAPQPQETVRTLQKLQDGIALGDAAAAASHARLLGSAARQFARAKPETWSEPRNARALVVFLFSGGQAASIADAIPESAIAPDVRTLYAGALAYGLGDDAQARDKLMGIDARTLPAGLGGRLALVQAILCGEDEKQRAVALLDLARLQAPGTLVEEAALRKELTLIGATGDIEKFGVLARRYANVFARSTYADNFRALLVSIAFQIGTTDTKEAGARLDRVAAHLDRGERRKMYLAVAREAVLSGRTIIASLAATTATKLAEGDALDESRAETYLGAATIFGDGYARGRRALEQAEPSRLDPSDQVLRTSALAVAEMIRREPATIQKPQDETDRLSTIAAGELAIVRADASLKRALR